MRKGLVMNTGSADVHPALVMAREHRLAGTTPSPSTLYRACESDSELYRHAMLEAGCLVDVETMKPEEPCSVCGWSAAIESGRRA
jgi:hypothetical protein